ncbi:AAA family ATPase [Methanoculleus sp. UBA303]|uniref:AAA family ATPase n=1 Tax=Methanoculleus sp. UBA303 TaxID=1915497 RepID=UPI0025EF4DA6|nr:AAA family ATPase [Methanoculleus sp. UBA303]
MGIPKNITREHVLQALNDIKPGTIPSDREATRFELIFNKHFFPPKYVLSIANRYANGEDLPASEFSGGEEANTYLRNLGFAVVVRSNFERVVKRLKELLRQSATDGELQDIIQARNEVIAKYQPVFAPSNIQNLSQERFAEFLLFENNKHWTNLYRQTPSVTANMESLRQALTVLADESQPISERLDRVNPKQNKPVKGLGKAILTAILLIEFPETYGIWNGTSENGLGKAGLWPELRRGASFGEQYRAINNVLVALADELAIDLWTLDALWWRYDDLSQSVRYWKVAPGWNAVYWESVWMPQGIASVDFNEFTEYYGERLRDAPELKSFQSEIQKIADENSANPAYDYLRKPGAFRIQSEMFWNFTHEMKEGDYIVANKGMKKILGIGIVKSPTKIDENLEQPFYRNVDWIITGGVADKPGSIKGNWRNTIIELSKDDFETILHLMSNGDGKRINPLFEHMRSLLKRKNQIILYGPPGTGKTWVVKEFVQQRGATTVKRKNILEDTRFFWLTINPERWDPENLWREETELWPGKYRSAFEEIQQDDIVFVYAGKKYHKVYAIAQCVRKEPGIDGYPKVFIKGIKGVEGPDWQTLKTDDLLSDAAPVKVNLRGTLFPLEYDEALQLLSLTQVDPDELHLTLTEEDETVKPYEFVTFHQSFSYEEFIEGLRPVNTDEGQIQYVIQEGIFKRLCREAFNALMQEAGIQKVWYEKGKMPTLHPDEEQEAREHIDSVPFYLTIDEINRGDISRIFGELITLIEVDKRLLAKNQMVTTLPYSKTSFGIPPNLYILGTMNTADKSIALIDIALRRRFGFIELMPDYEVLKQILTSEDADLREIYSLSIDLLSYINQQVTTLYDRDHQIGHSYLMRMSEATNVDEAIESLIFTWYHEILPLLQEYFYDAPAKLEKLLGKEFVEVDGRSFRFRDPLCGDDFIQACSRLIEKTKAEPTGGLL